MKNKTKKILAGIGLGIMGMGCLTGCTMSDDQKTALDSIVNKADEVIQLVETQNRQLSKQEAYEMIALANNSFRMGLIDEMEAKVIGKNYLGYFDEEIIPDLSRPGASVGQCLKYKRANNIVKFELSYLKNENETTEVISTYSDYEQDKYYHWYDDDMSLSNHDDSFSSTIGGRAIYELTCKVSDPNEIYNVSIAEDGSYTFTLLRETTSGDYVYATRYDVVIKDNLLRRVECWDVIEYNGQNTEIPDVRSSYFISEFAYENVDFSALDAKYAALQA